MGMLKRIKEYVDEYNSKCRTELNKIMFDKDSDNYYFSKDFKSLLTINSDLTIYSDYLDIIINEGKDFSKILEIIKEEKMKRNELLWGIEKSVGWINGQILNYKEIPNFFIINLSIDKISIFHKDGNLISIKFENLEINKENINIEGFEEYIDTLYIILQNVVKNLNVFYIKESEDDEYVLYNLFILDVDKFKKSKYVVLDSSMSLIEKDIVESHNKKLFISNKYKLGFSNRLYVEYYCVDSFENCINLINKKDDSIEKKITDILLKNDYNTVFEDIKISDKFNVLKIDTKFVKFVYRKENKKLIVNRIEDFEFDELRDLSEDMEIIENKISDLM